MWSLDRGANNWNQNKQHIYVNTLKCLFLLTIEGMEGVHTCMPTSERGMCNVNGRKGFLLLFELHAACISL